MFLRQTEFFMAPKGVSLEKNRPFGRFLGPLKQALGSMVAPNLLGGFNDQAQFVSLRFNGNVVAVNGA